MITRRKLFALLAAGGTLAAVESLAPAKTIFLPPKGGWLRMPYAQLMIPRLDAEDFYSAEIAKGFVTYDINTEMMSLWREPQLFAPVEATKAPQAVIQWRHEGLIGLDEFGRLSPEQKACAEMWRKGMPILLAHRERNV